MEAACHNVRVNGALVLSVAAGLSIDTLSRYLSGTRRIVRTMPNTPGKIGLGVSGMFAEAEVSEADRATADRIMRSVGLTVWLDEETSCTTLPALAAASRLRLYLLARCKLPLRRKGSAKKMPAPLSLATFKGAVALAEQSGEDFAKLQQNVTSKGGTTHEAIETFKSCCVAEAIAHGVEACVKRSQEMAQQYKVV